MPDYQPFTQEAFAQRTWKPYTDFRHAKGYASLPVVAQEISHLAAELPLVLQPSESGAGFELRVLVGLGQEGNACLDAQNHWRLNYVPSFIRSNPLAFELCAQLYTQQPFSNV